MLGARGELAPERAAQRGGPEPFVEIPQHHRGPGMAPCNRDKRARLGTPLLQAQAEMRGDQLEAAGGRRDFHFDGAAGLALGVSDVVDLRRAERPAAEHHLAVFAVGRDDGFGLDPVAAHRLAQHAESGARGCSGAARIHLLQRDHIRVMPQDGLDHAGKIEPAVGAEPAVDVPRHHPHRSRGGPRDGGCVTS
jgi:hypothetical protein